MKQTIYGNDARQAFLQAANELSSPVKLTLGPKGKNVTIGSLGDMAYSTKDGVTVARATESNDPFVNSCIQIIRQAASKTVSDAGDGTTTSTILACSLINEINLSLISGQDISSIKQELKQGLIQCVEIINKSAQPLVKDGVLAIEKLQQIATISANNDEKIGNLFRDAYQIIGSTGTVLLDESKKSETYIEAVKGMQQNRGYISPYFVTSPEKCEYNNPVYFVTDKNLTQQKDIMPIADYCHVNERPLIIFCVDINSDALGCLNVNRIKAGLQVCAITIPVWLKNSKEILRDIAFYTNATFCTEDNGFNIDNIATPEDVEKLLGESERFTATPKDCVIIGGAGTKDHTAINNRIAQIDAQINPDISDYDREQLQARKSKLNGGVAILYAGGTTDVERKETLARCEDAVLAVRSALEEGYCPGGGKIYLVCAQVLGNCILSFALQSIITQICLNADEAPDNIIKAINASHEANFGYNAKTDTLEDLCEAGVVDSAKVVRVALENAVSIALSFLNTDCIIVEYKGDQELNYIYSRRAKKINYSRRNLSAWQKLKNSLNLSF